MQGNELQSIFDTFRMIFNQAVEGDLPDASVLLLFLYGYEPLFLRTSAGP